ncbi:MAG: hypothetical protein H6760_03550 [Candidatus Nomurabacteria bacterium]|nr:MAG: hypothetical protein H6760_03550 [Candidatus Nomurabacteria bacterium]
MRKVKVKRKTQAMYRSRSQTQYSFSFLFQELLFDVVRFPFWWYSGGLMQLGRFWLSQMRGRAEQLSLRIWLRNMFTPMYGDYTKSGRIISFFLRIVVLVGRLFVFVLWFLIMSVFVIVWLATPPIITYAIIRQLF